MMKQDKDIIGKDWQAMKNTLSPKNLAVAIGVSESSVKRWADSGAIHIVRTAGGHRRIPLQEAVRFVRDAGVRVVRPELIGFPETSYDRNDPGSDQARADMLFEALRDGVRDGVLGLIQGWFLSGRDLSWIFDKPISDAMTRIGRLWLHQGDGVLLEHRATDLCIQAVTQLRLALPTESPDALVAVGASPADDPYLLASIMAATILQDAGMHAINLGPQTPLSVLQDAAETHHASMAWLSVSTETGAENASSGLDRLADAMQDGGIRLVVGGRAAGLLKSTRIPNLVFIDSMAELAAFAKGLHARS